MELTKERIVFIQLLSKELRNISFWLFDLIKHDLKDYLITIQDVNFLLGIEWYIDWTEKLEMKDVIKKILLVIKEDDRLRKSHCDPYELFIDAWRIDKDLNILLKV